MNVREAIETIGMQRLADLAGCTRTTIDRTKQRGDVSSSPTGARIRQAIRDQGLALDGDVPTGGAQPDLPMDQPIVSQIKDAELRQKVAAAAEKERKNAEAEGRLLPADEIAAAVGHAGAQLRTGLDGGRRRIEALCCEGCRDVIVAEYDGTMRTGIDAVLKALGGGDGRMQSVRRHGEPDAAGRDAARRAGARKFPSRKMSAV